MRTALTLSAVLLLAGCAGSLTPAKQAAQDRVLCEVDALGPLAMADAKLVVDDLEAGLTSVEGVIADAVKLAPQVQSNVASVKATLAMCRAQFPKLVDGPATVTQ